MEENNEPGFVIRNNKVTPSHLDIARGRGDRGPGKKAKAPEVDIQEIVRAIHKQSPQWMVPQTVQWFGTKLPARGYRGAGELVFFATGEWLKRGDARTSFGIVRCVDLITGQLITVEEAEMAVAIADALDVSGPAASRSSRARAKAEARARAYARASLFLSGVVAAGGVSLDALDIARQTHHRMGMAEGEQ